MCSTRSSGAHAFGLWISRPTSSQPSNRLPRPVEHRSVTADGELRELSIEVPIQRSSWVALRILPSGHTNPIFVRVGGKPVRASKRSAQWCLDSIDALWREKLVQISASELKAAEAAYEHARVVYRKIATECEVA